MVRVPSALRVVGLLGCLSLVVAGCNVQPRRAAQYAGPPEVPPDTSRTRKVAHRGGVDIAVADAREADLVEAVVFHRQQYRQHLEALRAFYQARGHLTKAQWAAFELSGLGGLKQFRYLFDVEIPSDALRPTEQIAEADVLFEQGLELMRRGGHGVPAIYRRDRMIEGANVFRRLIEEYPSSDKIDHAAFYLGEIHKEYLPDQEEIAVRWYERAWTWNSDTPHPARFQAAVVYDYRLHDRDRALELYRAVLKHETSHQSNVRFATRRIEELTGQGLTGSPAQP